MDLMQLRRRAMAFDGLPPEYQRVDYLQCTGRDSKIDTGVNGNDETLVFEFAYMPITKQAYYGHFGNYIGENNRCWRLIQSSESAPRQLLFSAMNRRAGASGAVIPVPDSYDSIINQLIKIRLSYGQIGTECDGFTNSSTTVADDYALSTTNVCIGSIGVGYNGAGADGRFYGNFKIWRNGALIRNYIPAIRRPDNKAGFYDIVNHTFNPSIGTVDFIAGNDE